MLDDPKHDEIMARICEGWDEDYRGETDRCLFGEDLNDARGDPVDWED